MHFPFVVDFTGQSFLSVVCVGIVTVFQLYRVDLVNFGFRRIFAFLENVQFSVQLTGVLILAE